MSVSVCVLVQNISKSYERILMKFLRGCAWSIRFRWQSGSPSPKIAIVYYYSRGGSTRPGGSMYALYRVLSIIVNKNRCRRRVPIWYATVRLGLVCSRRLSRRRSIGRSHSPVSKRDASFLWRFWRPMTLTFKLLNWKLSLHLLVTWGTFIPIILIFSTFFCFRIMSPYRTDGHARHVTHGTVA